MRLISILLALLLTGSVWATIPASIHYQGYLTDRDGSPEVGTTLITFSIYGVEVGGSPLWFDTLNIDIESGLLSVQLGRPANPFPVDLFETPLWLGITVEADQEMIPRRALTSVGFSFRAEDAESVQGKSAADLDQSLHVDDLANPHGVTATQAGAADQAVLDAHTNDTGNPHLTTAAQTGAANAALFSSHAADASAHHSRYSDTDAVSAMDVEEAINPLNHQRYSDTESVAAVLAADGDGSGLDADKLDGLDAQHIIQASSGVRLVSGGVEIGAVINSSLGSTERFQIALVSDKGYFVFADVPHSNPADLELPLRALYFPDSNCNGQPYLSEEFGYDSFVTRQGWVFQHQVAAARQTYYVPKGSVAQSIQVSRRRVGGNCQSAVLVITGHQAFLNDPMVTGILNEYTTPVTLERGSTNE